MDIASNSENQFAYDIKQTKSKCDLREMCKLVKKEMCTIVNAFPNDKSEKQVITKSIHGTNNYIDELRQNNEYVKIKYASNNLAKYPSSNYINQHNQKIFDSDLITENVTTINAHSIMRRFISRINVLTCNGRIYIYNGKYYAECCMDDIRCMILKFFREEIKDNSPSFVSSIVDYIKIEPDIRINDSHIRDDVLSFQNGILQLENRKFTAHDPSFITTYSICGNYIPDNVHYTPYWDSYLLQLTGGDVLLIERIYQMIGYILTSDTNGKCIFLLQGIGNSGKSVLTRFLEKLFSQGAYYPIHSDKLKAQFALSELFGRSLCVCQDMPNEALDMKAISILKSISGNDTISSDVKFKSAISFHCRAKIILTTNFGLVSKSRDDAFYSRLVTIPCKYSVPKSQQNPNLINQLFLERDGIITKSMEAYFRLVQNGYMFAGDYAPNTAIEFNENYSNDITMNIYNFIISTFEKDSEGCVFTDDAYELYVSKNPVISRNNFSENFKRICYENFDATDGRRYKKHVNEKGENVKSKNALRCLLGMRFKYEKS